MEMLIPAFKYMYEFLKSLLWYYFVFQGITIAVCAFLAFDLSDEKGKFSLRTVALIEFLFLSGFLILATAVSGISTIYHFGIPVGLVCALAVAAVVYFVFIKSFWLAVRYALKWY